MEQERITTRQEKKRLSVEEVVHDNELILKINDPQHPDNWWSKAELEFVGGTVPCMILHSLDTDLGERGKGYASQIMERIEDLAEEQSLPCVISDGIHYQDPASGMYGRRGWKALGEKGVMVYEPFEVSLSRDEHQKLEDNF